MRGIDTDDFLDLFFVLVEFINDFSCSSDSLLIARDICTTLCRNVCSKITSVSSSPDSFNYSSKSDARLTLRIRRHSR